VHAYYNAITKRLTKLADYTINPNIALVSFFMCCKTDEEARKRADGCTFFQFALRFYGASADRKRPEPGTVNMWDEYNKWKRANPDAQEAALRGGLIGSPDTLRRSSPSSRPPTSTRSSCSTRPARTRMRTSASPWSCSARGDAGVPGPPRRASSLEGQGHDREIELEEIETAAFKDRYGTKAMPAQVGRRKPAPPVDHLDAHVSACQETSSKG
jgi:hypothetical protein